MAVRINLKVIYGSVEEEQENEKAEGNMRNRIIYDSFITSFTYWLIPIRKLLLMCPWVFLQTELWYNQIKHKLW